MIINVRAAQKIIIFGTILFFRMRLNISCGTIFT